EDVANDSGVRDILVMDEVGPVYRLNKRGYPWGVLAKAGYAACQQAVTGKLRGLAKGNLLRSAQPFHIPPHVPPLRRIEIVGRIVQALLLENHAQHKGPPVQQNI